MPAPQEYQHNRSVIIPSIDLIVLKSFLEGTIAGGDWSLVVGDLVGLSRLFILPAMQLLFFIPSFD